MIGLVTDSNSQLTGELAARYGVEIVPITLLIDETSYQEGVDLDVDDFYRRQAAGAEITTSQPSPGEFAAAYEAVQERGATEILSVHVGSELSGTLNSARIAAGDANVEVRLVDTGQTSFSISCCVWEAAEQVAAGATLEQAAEAAEHVAGEVTNAFVVEVLDLARRSGRAQIDESLEATAVLRLAGTELTSLGDAHTVDEAVELMAQAILSEESAIRVGVGHADEGSEKIASGLLDALGGTPHIADLVAYRVGPSVGAFAGPGTAGAVWYPTSNSRK